MSELSKIKINDVVYDIKDATARETLGEYEDVFTGNVEESVQNWLDDHPDATTTVQDGSITKAKLETSLKTEIETNTSDVTDLKSATSQNINIINNSLNDTATALNVNWTPGWINNTNGAIVDKTALETNERHSDVMFLKTGTVITYSYATKPLYIYSYGANNSYVGRLTYLWPSAGSSETYTLLNDLYIGLDVNAGGSTAIDPTDYVTLTYKATYNVIDSLDDRVTALEGGGSVTVDSALSASSHNPVQNDAITNAINALQGQIDAAVIPTVSPVTVTGGSSCVIIAASNASAEVKANANYVCTGTDDQTIINDAIASLPASGGEIKLTNGLFVLSAPIIISRTVKIVGEGSGLAGRASYTPTNGNTYSNLYGRNVGVTTIRVDADVKGFQITSNAKISNIEFRDFLLLGYGKDRASKPGFSFEATTDLVMFDNVSVNDCFVGIYQDPTYYMDAPNIINSSFQWCGCGMVLRAVYGRISGNCIADNNGIGAYDGISVNCGGIMLKSGGNMLITDNIIIRPTIYADSSLSQPGCAVRLDSTTFVNISDNIIGSTQGNNIEATSATHITVNGNAIINPGLSANASYECNIYLGASCGEWIVTGNRMGKGNISDSGTALYPFYNSTNARGRCVIIGNIFYGVSNAPYYTDQTTVVDNNVTFSA